MLLSGCSIIGYSVDIFQVILLFHCVLFLVSNAVQVRSVWSVHVHVVYVVSFVNGPCTGVLPSYKFTAFQAVNLYDGSALAYVPCCHRDL